MLMRQQIRDDVEAELPLAHPVDGGDVDTHLEAGVVRRLAELGELLERHDNHSLAVRQVPGDIFEHIQERADDVTLGALSRFGLVDDVVVFGFVFDLRFDFGLRNGGVVGRCICGRRFGDASGSNVLSGTAVTDLFEAFAMILSWSVRIPCMRLCGPGGQPGT